jgi:hypothetical protein
VAVPSRLVERGEAALPRRAVRFFTGDNFIEYTTTRRTLTYNVRTGKTPEAFADAVRAKLRTPLPAWARRAPVVA